ncbi:type II secretion system F family protein [Primorskyibacter aestuariivivens]|uniref:type II secretion system F family protein n=1 Tax=Primorskyibacter aestuariivivens TaxID=1888912 RepID=UPI00230048AA|nr:type II secretion system F family protein [Primorskyibacter aestuariivivens]MDA7428438.1 type II secretion system F family protein [Primorskyibacter aestuariivivens]
MFEPGGLFYELMGPLAPVIIVGGLGMVLLLLAISMLLKQRQDPLDKLLESQKQGRSAAAGGPVLRHGSRNQKLDKYAAFLEPKDAESYSQIAHQLMQAGYRGKEAVRYFYAAQVVLGVAALAVGWAYYNFVLGPDKATTQQMVMYILGPGAAGYYLPKYWITRRAQARHDQIEEGFPDALDMMLVCVEAGQSMDQSIIRVSNEIQSSYPELAYEFQVVAHEIKAGKDKASVLNDMGERVGVQDVQSFVTVLVQSQTFGTSVAEALRVYAGEMRDKRVMRAEEKANKLPTKMTLATMALTVPPLLIILVGPSAHGIMQLGNLQ